MSRRRHPRGRCEISCEEQTLVPDAGDLEVVPAGILSEWHIPLSNILSNISQTSTPE